VPYYSSFTKDTKILTDQGYIDIQNLKTGSLIKTKENDFKDERDKIQKNYY
jgi:hypothetical protein